MNDYKKAKATFLGIMNRYKRCLTILSFHGINVQPALLCDAVGIPRANCIPTLDTDDEAKDAANYCKSLLFVLNAMDPRERMILWKEFATSSQDKKWWVNTYKTSTFSRLKRRALDNFFNIIGYKVDKQFSKKF